MLDLTTTSAFALLQQGMSDKQAYRICLALWLDQVAWEAFEQYAKDELKSQEEDQH